MAVMPERVLEALQRGDTIEAIRRLRAVAPLDLKSAKDLIDAFRRGGGVPAQATAPTMVQPMHPSHLSTPVPRRDVAAEAKVVSDRSAAVERLRLASGFGLAQSKDASDASRFRDHPTGVGGRSPGEMPNSGRLLWWIAVIALAGYAMWSGSGGGTTV